MTNFFFTKLILHFNRNFPNSVHFMPRKPPVDYTCSQFKLNNLRKSGLVRWVEHIPANCPDLIRIFLISNFLGHQYQEVLISRLSKLKIRQALFGNEVCSCAIFLPYLINKDKARLLACFYWGNDILTVFPSTVFKRLMFNYLRFYSRK